MTQDKSYCNINNLAGWGARTRTWEWRNQNPQDQLRQGPRTNAPTSTSRIQKRYNTECFDGHPGLHDSAMLDYWRLCRRRTISREIAVCASLIAVPPDIAHLSKYRWLIPSGTWPNR